MFTNQSTFLVIFMHREISSRANGGEGHPPPPTHTQFSKDS